MGAMTRPAPPTLLALIPWALFACAAPLPQDHEPAGQEQGAATSAKRPPNVVLMFVDDMGYGDMGITGHPTIRTPHLDRLAMEGMRFTQFVTACSVCSPSRAALLTGCYPRAMEMHRHVVFPGDPHGLHPDEVTLAECLADAGYATGMFGKWHLGHRRGMLPNDQGFDRWVGIPYSNDMAQAHRRAGNTYPYQLPFLEDGEVTEWEPDQSTFTRRLTEEAVAFMRAHRDEPFFVYVPHPMPHIPLYPGEAFQGASRRGAYGDVIEELDWSVGTLRATLEELGLAEDTLFLFSSDNGPWLPMRENGGSAGHLRGGKGTTWEGGHRVPLLAAWPGTIEGGAVCAELATAMDLAPTVAGLCGTELVGRGPLDGHDISPLLLGAQGAVSPTEHFLYYAAKGPLAAVRRGPWKLHLESGELYHLEHDVEEQRAVQERHAELAAELRDLAVRSDAALVARARSRGDGGELAFDPALPATGASSGE